MSLGLSALGGAGWQFFDNNGVPLAGGFLSTFDAGTTTPAVTYTSIDGSQPNSNPIVLDSTGRVEEEIWLESSALYKFVLEDSNNVEIWTKDDVPGIVAITGLDEFIALLASPIGSSLVGFTQPSGVPRTVESKLRDVVSVKDYGATGDGVTDDTAYIQGALNVAKYIFIPTGTYLVSSLMVLDETFLFGAGASAILKQNVVSQGTPMFSITSVDSVVFRDFVMDGNGDAQPAGNTIHGIKIVDGTGILIEDVNLISFNGDQINISSTTDAVESGTIKISQVTGFNLGRHGINVQGFGVSNLQISDTNIAVGTYVTSSTVNGIPYNIELTDTSPIPTVISINLINNIAQGAGIALKTYFNGCNLLGNTVYASSASTESLIDISDCKNIIVSNNILVGDTTTANKGIKIIDTGLGGSSDITNIIITNNTIHDVVDAGIYFTGTGSGDPSKGRVIIGNNTITNIGDATEASPIYIETTFLDVDVSSNVISESTGAGIVVLGCPEFSVTNNLISEAGSVSAIAYGIYVDESAALTGAGPGIITGNTASWDTPPTGSAGLYIGNGVNNTRLQVSNNNFGDTDVGYVIDGGTTPRGSFFGNVTGDASLFGTFTLANAATTVVNNMNIMANSQVIFFPANTQAGTETLVTGSIWVSAISAGVSFTVSTGNGVAAVGNENFAYWIIS